MKNKLGTKYYFYFKTLKNLQYVYIYTYNTKTLSLNSFLYILNYIFSIFFPTSTTRVTAGGGGGRRIRRR